VERNCIDLYSRLSPSECVSRLAEAIDRQRVISFTSAGSHPVIGRIHGFSFCLRKRNSYRNSFQTFLTGAFHPQGTGTRIQGVFAMHILARVFMSLWLGVIVVVGTIMSAIVLFTMFSGNSPHREGVWHVFVVPPVMFMFGVAVMQFGRYLARDEARFLTDLLRQVLTADDNTRSA
jgi:hypothetical protein